MSKIGLSKSKGPVVFLGSMNAMPMMYALELRERGIDVLYFVDAPISNTLNRPENHYSSLSYPYPEWIIEIDIKSQILVALFPFYYIWKIKRSVKQSGRDEPQAFILNGFFVSLLPYLSESVPVVSLSHGSDLDSWADLDGSGNLAESFGRRSIFKFLPKSFSVRLIRGIVERQFLGFSRSSKVIYFPRGFNSNGDRVVGKLKELGVECHERYDISFDPLKDSARIYKESGDRFVVFSGVRFAYRTFSEGNIGYNKGNDEVIKGLAQFYRENKNLEVHFVEKGPDVEDAKKLCEEEGLAPAVVWHKEMTLKELFGLYELADVCFDQIGSHWIGAIGGYALWLGKPLIANDGLPVKTGFWPKETPVCSASNAEEVYSWMVKLQDNRLRKLLYDDSKIFAETYMSAEKIIGEVFDFE